MLLKRIADKGTIYEREVCIDPDSLTGAQEVLESKIASFLQERIHAHKGKTAKKRAGGYSARRATRRSTHEAWMSNVRREPSRIFPHPFYGIAK